MIASVENAFGKNSSGQLLFKKSVLDIFLVCVSREFLKVSTYRKLILLDEAVPSDRSQFPL